jgi:hypothetical protein
LPLKKCGTHLPHYQLIQQRRWSRHEPLRSSFTLLTYLVHVYEPKIKVDLTKHVVQVCAFGFVPLSQITFTDVTAQHEFMFDSAFNEDSRWAKAASQFVEKQRISHSLQLSNNDVFQRTAKPLVEFVVSGGKVAESGCFKMETVMIASRLRKASCFAFGQTGSGKTHTMMGHREEKGLYLLAAQHLFNTLRSQGLQLQVSFPAVSFGWAGHCLAAGWPVFFRDLR